MMTYAFKIIFSQIEFAFNPNFNMNKIISVERSVLVHYLVKMYTPRHK